MVTVLKTEGGTQLLSSNLQKIIQFLKESTGNNSDTEVYNALRESNMDANEAAQKLLNQGPFHEVRRKRDKKKENAGYKDFPEHRKLTENANHTAKFYAADRNFNSFRRSGFTRDSIPEAVRPVSRNREFRVVRDNRVNQNSDKETKLTADAGPGSENHSPVANVSEESALGETSNHNHSARPYIIRTVNQMTDSRPKFARDINSSGHRKEPIEEKKSNVTSSLSHVQSTNQSHSQSQSTTPAPSNSVGGVYASASDPVHVPSPDSRSPAIKREVGVVGGCRQSLERISKQPSEQSNSNSNSVQDTTPTLESFQSIHNVPNKDPPRNASLSEPTMLNTSRVFSSHHGNRQHQPLVGHQRGALPGKEWKPKSSRKAKVSSPGVIGTPIKSASPPSNSPEIQETDTKQLHDKLSQVNIQQAQNVIIAQHIRVPENDRCRLTFGSFGMDMASSGESANGLQVTVGGESAGASESEEISDSKQSNSPEDQIRNSGSRSPSNQATVQQIPNEEETLTAPNLESYSDMGLVRDSSPSFSAPESQQRQEASELPNFAAYDPQTGYDIPYFRHVDYAARWQNLPSQEALTSQSANSIPASSIAMLQQQPPMAQMYPQVHASHFANVMPYRQFLSPLYVPPMGLPGYSSSPAYAHPSNGSSFVLMPGGGSHLAPNNLKYGVQQFKPVPAGTASGFGNFGSPTGYEINPAGIIGGATGLEDSARLKYKENNLYVPNPQEETSEVWIQNPRELPAMQSAPYYNMQGQAGHPAYLQSHVGHASFNPAAVAQSSHMQFPGVYHPPQPTGIPNPHMAAPIGGNVGVGVGPAAPGAQVGAYQQPQLGHLNWTTNF